MWRASAAIALVAAVAAVQAASSATVAQCEPTVSEGAGPIGTRSAVFPRRSRFGTGYVLTGKVLRSESCGPLAGAVVEIWQSGKKGYGPNGRASVVVGANGTFRFEGPLPRGYEGRPGHIHMRISARGYDTATVTHVVGSGRRTGREVVVLTSLL